MKFKRLMSTILCTAMVGSLLAGCGSGKNTETGGGTEPIGEKQEAEAGKVDLSEHVTLSLYLYGSPGAANEDILAEINKKLTEDINTSIEVKYIDWGDINTKYPLCGRREKSLIWHMLRLIQQCRFIHLRSKAHCMRFLDF